MIARLRARQEWALCGALWRAAPGHAVAWWIGVTLRGALPAAIAVTSGWLIRAVTDGTALTGPLVTMAVVFVASQVIGPLHEALGYDLGNRTATSLNDRLMAATLDPPGVAHLERGDLTDDLSMARDFDLGITGPPLSYSMNFIADGLVGLVSGVASAIVLAYYGWWQAIVLVARVVVDALAAARERGLVRPPHARRDAGPAPRRLLVPPGRRPPGGQGGPPVRPRRLGDRPLHRASAGGSTTCSTRRRGCASGRWSARWRSCSSPTSSCSGRSAERAADGDLDAGRRSIVAMQAAIGVSAIAFGGLNWALDGAAAPVAAVGTLRGRDGAGRRPADRRSGRRCRPAAARRSASATSRSAIPAGRSCSTASTSPSRPGRRWRSSARTAPARPRWPSCCAACTTRSRGVVEADGIDLRALDLDDWRRHVTAVFQDFVRFELSLRDNVAPSRRPSDDDVLAALDGAGAGAVADPRHPAGQGLPGWHRPLRRAVAARRARPCPRRRAQRRRRRAARRADRPARRARRGRDLRAHPRRHARHARRSSCRTASRPSARPTASACSSTARSSSSARTTS